MNGIRKIAAVLLFMGLIVFPGCDGTLTFDPAASPPVFTPGTGGGTDPAIPSVTQTFTQSAGFTNFDTVRVIDPQGNITLNVNTTATSVQISGTKSTDGPASQAATDRLNAITIIGQPLVKVPTTLQIQAAIPVTSLATNDRVDFNITIPAGANLELTTWNGLIGVTGNTGIVIARTGEGSIAVADNVGDLEVSTVNGQLVLANIAGNVTGITQNAPITAQIAIPAGGAINLTTSNAAVTLQVPFSTSANVFLISNNGTVTANFNGFFTANQQVTTNSIFATLGGGNGTINASTSNDTITFNGSNLVQ